MTRQARSTGDHEIVSLFAAKAGSNAGQFRRNRSQRLAATAQRRRDPEALLAGEERQRVVDIISIIAPAVLENARTRSPLQ